MSTAKLVETLSVGGHITTQELTDLKDAYTRVVKATKEFGERYELVYIDAVQKLEQVKSYISARAQLGS